MRLRELVVVVALAACGGCTSIFNGWLDPTQVGRFRSTCITMDLRRSVSVADEPTTEIEASEPTPDDLQVETRDYSLRPGDLIDISIFELMVPGQPWVEYRQVSWAGYITIPQVKQDILASGKSARELEKHIEKVLQDEQILAQPEVTVLVREARGMTFNILGAVATPRTEIIPRPNFRILDALASAGGTTPPGGPKQPLVKMVYVFRSNQGSTTRTPVPDLGGLDAREPETRVNFASVGTSGSVAAADEGGHWIYSNNEWKFVKDKETSPPPGPVRDTPPPVVRPAPTTRSGAASQPRPPAEEPLARPSTPAAGPQARQTTRPCPTPAGAEGWEELAAKIHSRRVIAIPLDKLEAGDQRYNVVIRDGDTVWVPPPLQGEFYIMGNVNRPGTFSLTGRDITIRQAITAAGGLGVLADPTRAELIRRIGSDQEQILAINIDRIFAGREPDIILKPDDTINVGTNALMPFLAVLRNAFRATYGFGFVYDRNFADIDSYDSKQNPDSIRRARRAALLNGLR